MKNKKGKGKKMKVKELINRLEGLDKNDPVQFYFLDNYNLEGCELETIIETDEQVEITIESTVHIIERDELPRHSKDQY